MENMKYAKIYLMNLMNLMNLSEPSKYGRFGHEKIHEVFMRFSKDFKISSKKPHEPHVQPHDITH